VALSKWSTRVPSDAFEIRLFKYTTFFKASAINGFTSMVGEMYMAERIDVF
jgi:hypothetical protein